ncbi:MAG: XdhC family protein [Pseudomonadota bacterium]
MTSAEILSQDLAEAAQQLRAQNQPFAFATIVRTAGPTAAKPGAKALLSADGTILQGWLGGGCTRGAVKRVALEALRSGNPQLVSVAPEDLLAEQGITPGDATEGRQYARNGCPSRGSVDIFIEPCLPIPQLVILGASPVADALATLAPQFHWSVSATVPEDAAETAQQPPVIVIATQGQGDLAALRRAFSLPTIHVAFVGSARKFATLAERLEADGYDPAQILAVKAPAGLDIGAVTAEEIALSILAELVQVRRRKAQLADE